MPLKKTKNDASNQLTSDLITIENIGQWIGHTTRLLVRFAFLLILLMSALGLAQFFQTPKVVEHLLGMAVFVVLFVMVVMLSIDHFIYRILKASVWGQIVLYSLVALVSSQSYLWAAGEVNRIFKVDPSVLGLTLTSMTALRFFEYTVAAILGSYGFALCFYFIIQALKKLVNQSSNKHSWLDTKGQKLLFSLLLMASIGSGIALMQKLSILNRPIIGDDLIKSLAVKIDFNQYHTCRGLEFNGVEAVAFLSANDLLTAKRRSDGRLQFAKVRCD